jgi:hypothetical protein
MKEIAVYVQQAMIKYANINIPIQINTQDTSKPSNNLHVSSAKLKTLLAFDNPINFEQEALSIFKLLEKTTTAIH